MCQPYGRTPPPRTRWPTYFIYPAQKEQIGYVLHKVGEDETMQRNKGCRTTKGADVSRNVDIAWQGTSGLMQKSN